MLVPPGLRSLLLKFKATFALPRRHSAEKCNYFNSPSFHPFTLPQAGSSAEARSLSHVEIRNWRNMSAPAGGYKNGKIDDTNRASLSSESEESTVTPSLTFVSRANPVTGKMEWVVEDENYDYIQEIARSGYGDMLNDTDRNEKYDAAIKQATLLLRQRGKKVKALDIGTGTGLLSMMAVRAGADSVVACEAFEPMARCAEKVLKANKCGDKVKLVHKRSTLVTEDDVVERANLLITELFDTELIGEGAIASYTDAHERLMEEECVAVPTSGRMYVQAVHSDLLRRWTSLQPIHVCGVNDKKSSTLRIPPQFQTCGGAPSLHDLQVDQLADKLTFISDPVEVFSFDFSKRGALKKDDQSARQVSALCDGRVDAFVMWWDLVMDPQGTILLSCAPCWVREKGQTVPWRDHWMQALYYPCKPLHVSQGEVFEIHSFHDEYSLWFDTENVHSARPVCDCGLHVSISRSRLGQMNQVERNELFERILRKHVTKATVCLVISDGTLFPLIAALLRAEMVFYIDTNGSSRKLIQQLVEHNGLQDRVIFLDKSPEDIVSADLGDRKIDLVLAEPFFQAASLPWEHIYFWYAVGALKDHMAPSVTVLPRSMTIRAIGVQFEHLHKIRTPVGSCEGFDITEFDKLIEDSSESADEAIEAQPLWEYPCRALSPPVTLTSLDFSLDVDQVDSYSETAQILFCKEGSLNGIALWTEYDLDGNDVISTGLLDEDWKGERVRWDMFSRQGVKLLNRPRTVQPGSAIDISVRFSPKTGDFCFSFKDR